MDMLVFVFFSLGALVGAPCVTSTDGCGGKALQWCAVWIPVSWFLNNQKFC